MKKIAVNTVKAFLKEHKREDAYTRHSPWETVLLKWPFTQR